MMAVITVVAESLRYTGCRGGGHIVVVDVKLGLDRLRPHRRRGCRRRTPLQGGLVYVWRCV